MHRNCEQCRSEFWAKMPWARFCSTTCRVLSAYHKKRIRRCIQPIGQGTNEIRAGLELARDFPTNVKRARESEIKRRLTNYKT